MGYEYAICEKAYTRAQAFINKLIWYFSVGTFITAEEYYRLSDTNI